jgi:hypothetical protein
VNLVGFFAAADNYRLPCGLRMEAVRCGPGGPSVVVRAELELYGKLWRAGLRVRLRYLVWLLLTVELPIFHWPFSATSW